MALNSQFIPIVILFSLTQGMKYLETEFKVSREGEWAFASNRLWTMILFINISEGYLLNILLGAPSLLKSGMGI